jgi:trigger factor
MSVVLALEEVGPCRKQLKIEVPAPAVEAEAERVVGEFARKARIPGFRKGKVPVALVKRNFADEIRQELVERLVPRYWRQAAAEKAIDPVGSPSVEHIHYHEGEPFTFTAIVEVRPEIELRNYRDFSLPSPAVEPTAEETARTLEELRRSHATWSPAERPAANGDRATVEVVEIAADGQATPSQNAEIEIGSPRVWPELSLAVTGLEAGQGSEFVRAGGEGEPERRFRVRLTALQAPKLPELDAEFAKHFGNFTSVEELEKDVAHRLRHSKEDAAREERERALLDQLTERHPMPLPEGAVHSEIEGLLREYAEGLSRRGVDLQHAEIDWQKIGEEARPHAERRVKARFLLDAIGDKEEIAVGEEEFEQALAVLARLQGAASGALRQRLDQSGELQGFRARMRREKVVRYLLGEGGEKAVQEG